MKRKREYELEQKGFDNLGDGVSWSRNSMIGKGSCGSVYLANLKKPKSQFRYLPSIFAVKSAELSVSGSIQKERQVYNNIQTSPSIIRCFGEEITRTENGDMVFNLLLEYGSGGALAQLIEKSGGSGLLEFDVRGYTKSILLGLDCIHECGYVHCDIKPENIILVSVSIGGVTKFRAKIGDFGYAKRANQTEKVKLDPYFRGTPMYLSPETVIDSVQECPSDIWALGCIVLEMLTGKSPWDVKNGLTAKGILGKIGDGDELPMIPNEISKEGKDFLKCCFVRKARCRWTAEMLLNHPFVDGLVDYDVDGNFDGDEFLNSGLVDLSLPLLVTDDELCSSCSGDSSILSEFEFSYDSLPEEDGEEVVSSRAEDSTTEVKETGDVTRTSITPRLGDIIETSKDVSSNTMLQNRVTFTIPAGV